MPYEKRAPLACFEYSNTTKANFFASGTCSSSRSTGTATPDLLSDASSQASWRPIKSQSSAQTTPDSISAHIQPSLLSGTQLGALQDQVNLVDVTSWRDGVEREAVPAALRQNARRSKSRLEGQSGPPSTLVRQPERRLCFVSSLVVFAAGLISAIWPLSSPVLHDTSYAHSVLPLQDFITETLRRSKTSYSTLQVAMFYLVLLKDKLPSCDFTQEQSAVSRNCRAMQCGRRMFLSALMLASKFLQDRNYSTRAWGKITGLPTLEINRNELNFLDAVKWEIHVSKERFERWSHIVISLCGPPPPGARSIQPSLVETLGWSFALARLSADCAEDFSTFRDQSACYGHTLKHVDLFGLLTPPSSPPDTTASDQEDSLSSEEVKVEKVEETSTPLAPPPAPYQANLPTPRGTPRLAQTSCLNNILEGRCRDSAIALAMLKASAKPASRELCPPPSKPYPTNGLRSQSSRRSSISSCISSSISVSTTNSSPPSLCSDLSSMQSRSRSSSISEADASLAHLRAIQSSESAIRPPWVSYSPKYANIPGSDCSSLAGINGCVDGSIVAVAKVSEPAQYVFPARTLHADLAQPANQPQIYDEGARRSSMRRPSKLKNKRTHSKTDICGLVQIPEHDVQSLVRKELLADVDQCHSAALPRIESRDDCRSSTLKCKRSRRTVEQTPAVDHARHLLRNQSLARHMEPCRRRPSSQNAMASALGR